MLQSFVISQIDFRSIPSSIMRNRVIRLQHY